MECSGLASLLQRIKISMHMCTQENFYCRNCFRIKIKSKLLSLFHSVGEAVTNAAVWPFHNGDVRLNVPDVNGMSGITSS